MTTLPRKLALLLVLASAAALFQPFRTVLAALFISGLVIVGTHLSIDGKHP